MTYLSVYVKPMLSMSLSINGVAMARGLNTCGILTVISFYQYASFVSFKIISLKPYSAA